MADHCSIVPHVTEPRVLVAAEGAYWTLPRHKTEDAEAIRELMRQRYGLDVTVLGAYAGHYAAADIERDEPVFIFALETHGSTDTLPDGVRWISHDDLANCSWPTPNSARRSNAGLPRWRSAPYRLSARPGSVPVGLR